MNIQHVSSLGGPRVLLPTQDVSRWIAEMGDPPNPEHGLYCMACSIGGYCGVITPWETPLLIFGDDPANIFFVPDKFDGLFFRWVGADSIEQLAAFVFRESQTETWDETTPYTVVDGDLTLMDACTFDGDSAPRIRLSLQPGSYTIESRYAESPGVMAMIHRMYRIRIS